MNLILDTTSLIPHKYSCNLKRWATILGRLTHYA